MHSQIDNWVFTAEIIKLKNYKTYSHLGNYRSNLLFLDDERSTILCFLKRINCIWKTMKIKSERTITEKEGYEAMLYMLQYYWELTGSNDLTDILSGGEYIDKDTPADSAFWEYWLDAIEKVKKDGPPPLKKIR